MKLRLFSALMVVFALGSACKNEKAAEGEKPAEAPVSDVFKVTERVIVKKDDNLSLFYTEDGTSNFQEEPIWKEVTGNAAEQDVVFELPADVFPTTFRLDIGGNKTDQDTVVLKSVTFEYKGKKRTMTGTELATYFRADEAKCTFDPATGIIVTKAAANVKKGGSLYPLEEPLKAEMEKLAQ